MLLFLSSSSQGSSCWLGARGARGAEDVLDRSLAAFSAISLPTLPRMLGPSGQPVWGCSKTAEYKQMVRTLPPFQFSHESCLPHGMVVRLCFLPFGTALGGWRCQRSSSMDQALSSVRGSGRIVPTAVPDPCPLTASSWLGKGSGGQQGLCGAAARLSAPAAGAVAAITVSLP